MAKETVQIVCAECGETDVIDRYVTCESCDKEADVTEWDTYCEECSNEFLMDSAVCEMCTF